jgi:predicted nucleic acid-binding protein
MFLELALAGHADAVVTGDRGLLVAASAFPIPVLPPAELRLRLRLSL